MPRRVPLVARHLLWLLLSLWSAPGRAEGVLVPAMPKDFDQVDAYLITVGRGEHMDAVFGHSILRIVDKATHQDLNFNWGIYDFADPRFAWNFYRGDLRYSLGIYDLELLIDFYRNVEHRGMVQDQLMLTSAQKRTLMQRLIRNSLPDNLTYQYSQLRDNCATRPRDHLDAALGGQLFARLGSQPANTTYRYYIRQSTTPVWWVYMGLDMLTNDVLDQPLTLWQEMFLPGKLRQHLRSLPALDDHGKPVAGVNLLGATQTLVDLPEPHPGSDPFAWLAVITAPLILLALAAWRSSDERRVALLLATVSLVFGLWSAVWGTVLVQNWLYSQYIEVKHNAQLWLYWPVDWVYVWYACGLLKRRQRPLASTRCHRLLKGVSLAHMGAFAVAVVLWAGGLMRQDMLPSLATGGVFGVLYYGTILRRAAVGGDVAAGHGKSRDGLDHIGN